MNEATHVQLYLSWARDMRPHPPPQLLYAYEKYAALLTTFSILQRRSGRFSLRRIDIADLL